jgi:hypothetical protein
MLKITCVLLLVNIYSFFSSAPVLAFQGLSRTSHEYTSGKAAVIKETTKLKDVDGADDAPFDEIETSASKFVVQIDGESNSGTGFIVSKSGELYTVITNKHVIEEGSDYFITTPDRRRYKIEPQRVRRIPNIDIVEIVFRSSLNYSTAKLNYSFDPSKTRERVYAYGFAGRSEKLLVRSSQFLPGNITGNVSKSDNGYSLTMNLPPIQGMSGSPLLNKNGQVIGVYGGTDRNPQYGNVTVTLGIPIGEYLSRRNFRTVFFENRSNSKLYCEYWGGGEWETYIGINGRTTSGAIYIFGQKYRFRCSTTIDNRSSTVLTYFDVTDGGTYKFSMINVPCSKCADLVRLATVVYFPNGKNHYSFPDL